MPYQTKDLHKQDILIYPKSTSLCIYAVVCQEPRPRDTTHSAPLKLRVRSCLAVGNDPRVVPGSALRTVPGEKNHKTARLRLIFVF